MSDAVRTAASESIGLKKSHCVPVRKVPIGKKKPPNVIRKKSGKVLRLISVGRLVPFKNYNREIPAICSKLIAHNIDIEWDIWGEGEDYDFINARIRESGLQDVVRLRGVLPYAEFDKTVVDADLFVGMGTAAVEAASLGVPTVCCVDQLGASCYGFLHDAPSDAIGEYVEGFPYRQISDQVRAFSLMDDRDRIRVSELCIEAASAKCAGGSYDDLINVAPPQSFGVRDLCSLVLAAPYLWAVDTRRSRFILRRIKEAFSHG